MPAATALKPKIKIHPLEDRVIILPVKEATPLRGGLHIPDTAREKPTQGEVVAVGPGRWKKGERVKMEIGIGDTVVYGRFTGMPYTADGEEYVIIKASDILARID